MSLYQEAIELGTKLNVYSQPVKEMSLPELADALGEELSSEILNDDSEKVQRKGESLTEKQRVKKYQLISQFETMRQRLLRDQGKLRNKFRASIDWSTWTREGLEWTNKEGVLLGLGVDPNTTGDDNLQTLLEFLGLRVGFEKMAGKAIRDVNRGIIAKSNPYLYFIQWADQNDTMKFPADLADKAAKQPGRGYLLDKGA